MAGRITMYDYLASYNPSGARSAMTNLGYGLHNCNSAADLATCLKKFVNHGGEAAIKELALIHPDRDIILGSVGKNFAADGFQDEPATIARSSEQKNIINADHTPLFMTGLFASALFLSVAIIALKL